MGVSDIGRGAILEWEGELWSVEDYTHMKKAQRRPVAQCKLRNIKTGKVLPMNFIDNDPFKVVHMEGRKLQYLFKDGSLYTFMDIETYDQLSLNEEQLGDLKQYLKNNMEVQGLFYNDEFVKVDAPNSVELQVSKTDPGVRGDTVSNVMKPATLETGLQVKVPLFIKAGDWIKVDTRSGEYVERVNR